jgi:hypothetical protein
MGDELNLAEFGKDLLAARPMTEEERDKVTAYLSRHIQLIAIGFTTPDALLPVVRELLWIREKMKEDHEVYEAILSVLAGGSEGSDDAP